MDPTVAFVIAMICGVVGLVLGISISPFRKSRPREREERAKESLAPERSGLVEVARLFTDGSRRKVFLQVRGRFIRSMDELGLENRAYLAHIFDQLRAWVGPSSAPASAPEPAGVATAPQGAVEAQRASLATGEVEPALEGVKPPSLNVVDVVTRALRPETPAQPALKSIAAQVDEILQEKLVGTPLEKRGIRLVEPPGKGLVVMVGLEQYAGVNEVPDEDIRAALKAAVAEWERRTLGK